jgi:hypothetical protein
LIDCTPSSHRKRPLPNYPQFFFKKKIHKLTFANIQRVSLIFTSYATKKEHLFDLLAKCVCASEEKQECRVK